MSNLVIQTNVLALNAHRNLTVIGKQQSTASARLSSGYKINSAADDAAGLAISEKMRSQIRGLDMASKNAQDASSLVQTAEGGMNEIDNMVQRIRELVVYASNDTMDQSSTADVQGDRRKVQDEIDQLLDEIDSMSSRVEFNKKTLINGTYSSLGVMDTSSKTAIADANDAYKLSVNDLSTAMNSALGQIGLLSSKIDAGNIDGSGDTGNEVFADGAEKTAAQTAISDLVASINTNIGNLLAKGKNVQTADVTTAMSDISTKLSAVTGMTIGGTDAGNINLTTLGGNITTAITGSAGIQPMATAMQSKAAAVVTAENGATYTAGTQLYFQLGANANQGLQMNIGSVDTQALGLAAGLGSRGSMIDVMKLTGAATTGLLNTLDSALTIVTTERSKLGAVQNRLEYTQSSLDISSENLSDAESRIRDTDMGQEMMKLTAANILQQAGISMLAQANQSPQSVLQLLR